HFDDRRQQACALAEIGRLEQCLLLAWIEGANHRDRGDEALARYRSDRIPIGRDLVLLKKTPEPAHQPLAIKVRRLLALDISGKLAPVWDDAAVALQKRQFLADPETRGASQGDQKASIFGLGKRGNASGAARRIDWRVTVRGRRIAGLDHADQTLAGKCVARHRQIARLENVQRQPAAGGQQNAGQREDRGDGGWWPPAASP